MVNKNFIYLFFVIVLNAVDGKVYERCELARELLEFHEIPESQVATWVCIARHESEFNTSARNHGSGDHGLFQISQLFWCSPPGYACGVSCKDLRDDDIEDDVICARRVYREHKRISGDGFNAWVVYHQFCKNQEYVNKFLDGCFDGKFYGNIASIPGKEKPLPTVNYYPQFIKRTTTNRPFTRPITTLITDRYSNDFENIFSTLKPTNRFSFTDRTTVSPNSILFHNGPNEYSKNDVSKITTKAFHTTTQKMHSIGRPREKFTTKYQLSATTQNAISDKKTFKPIEDNQDFVFSISKTGYKFSRKS